VGPGVGPGVVRGSGLSSLLPRSVQAERKGPGGVAPKCYIGRRVDSAGTAMSTTTIRLPEELKARVERLAAASGGTVHAFMLEAIAEVAERIERRQDFEAEAERRLQHMQESGEYLTLEDLRGHATALAGGERPAKPAPRTMTPQELTRFRASMRRTG